MTYRVCKFGGTSVASAKQITKVRQIIDGDPDRKVIIVSAPGKRVKTEPKVTDLLYLCHETAQVGADFSGPFGTVRERFAEIERELDLRPRLAHELDKFEADLKAGCTRDYVASRGEFFCAQLFAELLGAEFVEPADCIRLSHSGSVDRESYELLGSRMRDPNKRYVIPGFYGRGPDGNIKTFSRGGSDITGAIAARAVSAIVYENWTDVSGLLMADPRIVDHPRPLPEVTYRELRELSYMGASVLHDEATLPVREVGIPIHIRNTDQPEHPGSRIVTTLSRKENSTTDIAGIAGKKGFSMVCVEKMLMNKEVGFMHRLLGVFQRRGISVEHCPSSIDGINVIADTESLAGQLEEVVEEIQRLLMPDKITIERDLALIAVVGEGMSQSIGIAARVFAALRDAKVNVRVIDQGASELNIIVGISPDSFESAVRALYQAFVTPTQC